MAKHAYFTLTVGIPSCSLLCFKVAKPTITLQSYATSFLFPRWYEVKWSLPSSSSNSHVWPIPTPSVTLVTIQPTVSPFSFVWERLRGFFLGSVTIFHLLHFWGSFFAFFRVSPPLVWMECGRNIRKDHTKTVGKFHQEEDSETKTVFKQPGSSMKADSSVKSTYFRDVKNYEQLGDLRQYGGKRQRRW